MQKYSLRQAVALAVLLGIVALLFFYRGNYLGVKLLSEATPAGQGQSEPGVTSDAATAPSARTIPEGTREYRSTAYRFSLFYPQELTVGERDEGGGASTITFQNVAKAEGFQIFIVPYTEAKVSEARFKQDVPSGVRESLSNITVDGATAAAFYSTNALLGATREVWFVRNGFLYEVTTLKPLDAWMDAIIQTWKFI